MLAVRRPEPAFLCLLRVCALFVGLCAAALTLSFFLISRATSLLHYEDDWGGIHVEQSVQLHLPSAVLELRVLLMGAWHRPKYENDPHGKLHPETRFHYNAPSRCASCLPAAMLDMRLPCPSLSCLRP